MNPSDRVELLTINGKNTLKSQAHRTILTSQLIRYSPKRDQGDIKFFNYRWFSLWITWSMRRVETLSMIWPCLRHILADYKYPLKKSLKVTSMICRAVSNSLGGLKGFHKWTHGTVIGANRMNKTSSILRCIKRDLYWFYASIGLDLTI